MARLWARLAALLLAVAAGTMVAAAPASAAVPDKFAFVLWNGAATVPTGTVPAATSVVTGPPGRYRITFPGAGVPGGVVHVTAINWAAHWCQANTFFQSGADEIVYIDCYRAGGVPDFTAFTAFFERSSLPSIPINGRFGYIDAFTTGATVSQFNSAGAVNSAVPAGVGLATVWMPGLSTAGPIDGSIQATAVGPTPARCKVLRWSSSPSGQVISVACFNAMGALVNSRFTLTFQYNQSLYGAGWPPRYFGYVWLAPPVGPPTTNFNSQVGFGANTITPAGVGLALVRFPRIGVTPDTVQVTAAGPNSDFCSLNTPWTHLVPDTFVRDVACFNNAGVPTNTGFLVSDNSAL